MSVSSAAEENVTSSPVLATANTVLSSIQFAKGAAPDVCFLPFDSYASRPVNGVVGHCFVRVCLWVDLLASWRRSHALPAWPGTAASRSVTVPDAEMRALPAA